MQIYLNVKDNIIYMPKQSFIIMSIKFIDYFNKNQTKNVK